MAHDGSAARRAHRVPRGATPGDATAREVDFDGDDIVLLAVKSDATADVLTDLATVADPATPSLPPERRHQRAAALRWFESVYGVCVMCPRLTWSPAWWWRVCTPTVGLLDIGRYPGGTDDVSEALPRPSWRRASSRASSTT